MPTHSDSLLGRALAELALIESNANDPESRTEYRYTALETIACEIAGIDYRAYRSAFGLPPAPNMPERLPVDALRAELDASGLHLAVALAALGETIKAGRQRQTLGSHFTDFRLAALLAEPVVRSYRAGMTVIDPAAGSGILLASVAAGLEATQQINVQDFVRNGCFAADIQPGAVRGTRLALTPFALSLEDLEGLDRHLFQGDSLGRDESEWVAQAADGFGFVIANPPWARLRTTTHEIIKIADSAHSYGSESKLTSSQIAEIQREKAATKLYARSIGAGSNDGGDPDLYRLFLRWALRNVAKPGLVSMLVPAGLIRSKSDADLRLQLLEECRRLDIDVFDNKSKFFDIDSRFKFLHVVAEVGRPPESDFKLSHSIGEQSKVRQVSSVVVPRSLIGLLNSDATIPEVRTEAELDLLVRMFNNGTIFGDKLGMWKPHVVREVDMTRSRTTFSRKREDGFLPVIEGRMVHQFRSRAKRYVSGSGRSALWVHSSRGDQEFAPQFWMAPEKISDGLSDRASQVRAGFCDITGQTNERTLLAAALPAGVVSGNKVPTVTFGSTGGNDELVFLWTAVANSFAVDWVLRRSITTTLNYFILKSLIMPRLDEDTIQYRRLVTIGQLLADIADNPLSIGETAALRTEADVLVFDAFKLRHEDASLILQDFPSLDRTQAALPGESRSTVTADTLLSVYGNFLNVSDTHYSRRANAAEELGARAYTVSSER